MTSYEDTARFLVNILKFENNHGDFEIVGNRYSTNEIAQIASKVTGQDFTIKNMGNEEDLE